LDDKHGAENGISVTQSLTHFEASCLLHNFQSAASRLFATAGMFVLAFTALVSSSAPRSCSFCGLDGAGLSHTFDLASLSTRTFGMSNGAYSATTPCGSVQPTGGCFPPTADPAAQGCRGLGTLAGRNASVQLAADGFNLTMLGGSDNPPCGSGQSGHRQLVYRFVCDEDAPADGGPDANVTEFPHCTYVVTWRHPAACDRGGSAASCAPMPPAPPAPPPAVDVRRPTWKPTWDMMRSTVLYTCNNTGMHDVSHAVKFGLVVYDWSNAKALWANAHPMDSEELLTKQAEMVLAADPGVPGEQPRVWVYRNTIKALNWYGSVRDKLDDPKYASWFIKFKGFGNSPYPGGQGRAVNESFHVPTCDWYGDDKAGPPKCSGFYHDQEQTPNHAKPGGGSYPAYRVDGECVDQCDCGPTNPCGEYIFDHRGGEVEGRTFRDWFINEYMVTNETILHKDPKTDKPQMIGLGWLDDSMGPSGPSEEDKNYIADTGADSQEMQEQVAAYRASIQALKDKVLPMGGFWWQLMSEGTRLAELGSYLPTNTTSREQCKKILRGACVPKPNAWNRMAMYKVGRGGAGFTADNFTQYTTEFLLTRGPYAMVGYSWCGCTNGGQARPRAKEWDEDFGEPVAGDACAETGNLTGVFVRHWTKATVQWDCATGRGTLTRK
jgi:hypothetical protein